MLLSEYVSEIVEILDTYAKANLIADSDVYTDFRTEKIGLVKGGITFINNSKLFFSEYLDVRYKIEKFSYSYHYQDKDGHLLFRYDNAKHKPDLGFEAHKHLMTGPTIEFASPDLKGILEEIMDYLL